MDTESTQVKVVVSRKIKIQLARVVEVAPFMKKTHNESMASEVRRAINRWFYLSQ
jgi:hypothetical protein